MRTVSLRNSLISALLPKTEDIESTNVVYSFRCKCDAHYIGECESLKNRVQDHQQKSKNTAIYAHTAECAIFRTCFEEKYSENNFRNRFEFLSSMFVILHKNLDYDKRKSMEAIEIRLNDPCLNRQVLHKKVYVI